MLEVQFRKAVNVHIVTNNTVHVTRRDILKWLGELISKDLKRVEDLSNGAVYCIVMNQLFPGCISLSKVKLNTRSESEAMTNFKLLSNAFRELEVKKDIPVENLVKGVFSDNFRFAQWFKLFYDANYRRSHFFQDNADLRLENQNDRPPSDDRPTNATESQTAQGQREWKTKESTPKKDEAILGKLPPPSPTTTNLRHLAKDPIVNAQGSCPNKLCGINRKISSDTRKKDGEDMSDVISIDPSDASSSEGYHVARFVKVGYSSTQPGEEHVKTEQTVSRESSQLRRAPGGETPFPKRRNASTTRPKLPPPSPTPSGQHVFKGGRATRRSAIQAHCASREDETELQASGDRPAHASSATTPIGRDSILRVSGAGPNSRRLSPVDHEPSEEDSTKPTSQATTNPNSRSACCKHTNKSDCCIVSNGKNFDPHLYPSMREIQMNQILSSELISESEVQRELAILRYGTIEQRRALFFCQKEAQFYFKKLRKIENLCQHVNENVGPTQKELLEAIFNILYETEDGFMCPEDA